MRITWSAPAARCASTAVFNWPGPPATAAPYDVAIALPPGADLAPYAEAGATWWLTEFEPVTSLDQVRGVVRDGPPDSGR